MILIVQAWKWDCLDERHQTPSWPGKKEDSRITLTSKSKTLGSQNLQLAIQSQGFAISLQGHDFVWIAQTGPEKPWDTCCLPSSIVTISNIWREEMNQLFLSWPQPGMSKYKLATEMVLMMINWIQFLSYYAETQKLFTHWNIDTIIWIFQSNWQWMT